MINGKLKILFIGDIVGRPGRKTAAHFIPMLRKSEGIDLVVANGENLSAGKGMTFEKYEEMIAAGVDYFTSGNHIWNNRDIIPHLKDGSAKVLRPANYPGECPGKGEDTIEIGKTKVTLVNLLGRVFIPVHLSDPFVIGEEIADSHKDSIIIIDMHAEATSEKSAIAHYLDGRVAAVLGTHTHVQTSDEQILPGGTAFISDTGMCGPIDSVLGVKKDIIIKQFLTAMPQSHKVASGRSIFNAVVVEIDTKTKKAMSIKRINEEYNNSSDGGE